MSRKYLEDLENLDYEAVPTMWCPDDKRNMFWQKERDDYGFDSRETWSMDASFVCWLYEHLTMYLELNNVALESVPIAVDGKELNLAECIDIMISDCKRYLTGKKDELEGF